MQRLSYRELQVAFRTLTGKNLQLAGGIHNYDGDDQYSIAYSVDGVQYYKDELDRGRYTLQGLSGDQTLESRKNSRFLSPGRKIVLIQKVRDGVYILHGVYEYRNKLELLYHPGKDGLERRMYRALLHKL